MSLEKLKYKTCGLDQKLWLMLEASYIYFSSSVVLRKTSLDWKLFWKSENKDEGFPRYNSQYDQTFRTLRRNIMSTPIFISNDCNKPYQRYINESHICFSRVLMQPNYDLKDRYFDSFYKKLCLAEQNYTNNDREVLEFVYFLQRFRC